MNLGKDTKPHPKLNEEIKIRPKKDLNIPYWETNYVLLGALKGFNSKKKLNTKTSLLNDCLSVIASVLQCVSFLLVEYIQTF
jgi:hypothetical protein